MALVVNGVWTFLLTGTPIVTRVGECGCLGLQCGRSNPCGGICTNVRWSYNGGTRSVNRIDNLQCTECLCPRGSCGSSDLCEGDNVCDCNGFLCGAITACGEVRGWSLFECIKFKLHALADMWRLLNWLSMSHGQLLRYSRTSRSLPTLRLHRPLLWNYRRM